MAGEFDAVELPLCDALRAGDVDTLGDIDALRDTHDESVAAVVAEGSAGVAVNPALSDALPLSEVRVVALTVAVIVVEGDDDTEALANDDTVPTVDGLASAVNEGEFETLVELVVEAECLALTLRDGDALGLPLEVGVALGRVLTDAGMLGVVAAEALGTLADAVLDAAAVDERQSVDEGEPDLDTDADADIVTTEAVALAVDERQSVGDADPDDAREGVGGLVYDGDTVGGMYVGVPVLMALDERHSVEVGEKVRTLAVCETDRVRVTIALADRVRTAESERLDDGERVPLTVTDGDREKELVALGDLVPRTPDALPDPEGLGVTETLPDVEIDAVADGDGDVDREMEEDAVPVLAPEAVSETERVIVVLRVRVTDPVRDTVTVSVLRVDAVYDAVDVPRLNVLETDAEKVTEGEPLLVTVAHGDIDALKEGVDVVVRDVLRVTVGERESDGERDRVGLMVFVRDPAVDAVPNREKVRDGELVLDPLGEGDCDLVTDGLRV